MVEPPENTTPRNNPTYGVHLPYATITSIVQYCLPGIPIPPQIKRLPTGKSYNNRIYFIEGKTTGYVLKVNGRFFGPTKIENEVSCLLLLNHYCQSIPTPRVIAWSCNGPDIVRWPYESNSNDAGMITPVESKDLPSDTPGWILMTRVPGEALQMSSVPADQRSALMAQLSDIVLSLRRNMPKSAVAGSCNFKRSTLSGSPDHLYRAASAVGLPDIYIHGLVGIGKGIAPPTNNLLGYWKAKLACLLQELKEEVALTPNREAILPLMADFIDNTMPHLHVFQNPWMSSAFTFSHTDIAPRNVLVSYDPVRITGLVDFEFSGFLPSTEEFFQEYTKDNLSADDWPREQYLEFLGNLEQEGEVTPVSMQGTREWDELYELENLETTIAPWWIEEGDSEGLAHARNGAVQAVKKLRELQQKEPS